MSSEHHQNPDKIKADKIKADKIKAERDRRVLENHKAINAEQLRLEADFARTGDPALLLAALNEIIETGEEARERLRENLEDFIQRPVERIHPHQEAHLRSMLNADMIVNAESQSTNPSTHSSPTVQQDCITPSPKKTGEHDA